MRSKLSVASLQAAVLYAAVLLIGVTNPCKAQSHPSGLLTPVELLSPRNDSTNIRSDVMLIWQRKDSAAEYRVEMSKYPTFDTLVVNDTIAARSYAISGLERLTTYYWRVRGIDGLGISGEWSDAWHFRTSRGKPLTPVQIFPEDRAVEVAYQRLDLFWREDTIAASYTLQVSHDSTFQASVSNVVGLKTNHATIDHLDSLTTYYWRVIGKNEEGMGAWSSIRSFTTKAPPLTVREHVVLQDISVYPNPAVSVLQLSSAAVKAIYLTDILGRQFLLHAQGNACFDVQQLPRGMYILQFIGKDGAVLPERHTHLLLQ